jgi:hypothetical protein
MCSINVELHDVGSISSVLDNQQAGIFGEVTSLGLHVMLSYRGQSSLCYVVSSVLAETDAIVGLLRLV